MSRSLEQLHSFRDKLRKNPTPSERVFGRRLYEEGIEHHFQLIMGFYIVDFVIPDKMAILEIDGPTHDTDAAKRYDRARDLFFRSFGFIVRRIRNEEAATFDLSFLSTLPSVPPSQFRLALARSNVQKQKALKREADRKKGKRKSLKGLVSKATRNCQVFFDNLMTLRGRPWTAGHPLFSGLDDLLKRRCLRELRRRWKAAKGIERVRKKRWEEMKMKERAAKGS